MVYFYTYFTRDNNGNTRKIAHSQGPLNDNIAIGERMLYKNNGRFYSYKILDIWHYKQEGTSSIEQIYVLLDGWVEYSAEDFPGIW